jgi:hypothetical protein
MRTDGQTGRRLIVAFRNFGAESKALYLEQLVARHCFNEKYAFPINSITLFEEFYVVRTLHFEMRLRWGLGSRT